MWGIPVYSDVDMTVTVVTGAASGMGRLCVESLRGTTDHLVTVDLVAPQIEGTVGIACDVSDHTPWRSSGDRVQALGSFRGLAHAAGVSPTMTHSRRILEIDLVGTALLLEAFEPLVEPGSAAVCFSSSSAYQVALRGIDTELQSLVSEPWRRVSSMPPSSDSPDSGLAYAWAKRGVIAVAARAAVTWGRRGGRVNSLAPGLIDTPMGRQEAEQQPIMKVDAGEDASRTARPARRGRGGRRLPALRRCIVHFRYRLLVDGGMLQGLIALRQRASAGERVQAAIATARRTNSANSKGWVR